MSDLMQPDARLDGRQRDASVTVVANTFVDLMRTLGRDKARMPHDDVECPAHVLLRILGAVGPVRVSALAEWAGYDVSTVSRQVAALEKDGLLERHTDTADGRACLVAPTASGRTVIAGYDEIRISFFDHMLRDWSASELDEFAARLVQFARSYDDVGRAWIADRLARHTPDSPLATDSIATDSTHDTDHPGGTTR